MFTLRGLVTLVLVLSKTHKFNLQEIELYSNAYKAALVVVSCEMVSVMWVMFVVIETLFV